MKVMKFGGTSVGTPQRIKNVVGLINDNEPKLVVLSALSGTTNTLIQINDAFYAGNSIKALQIMSELEKKYYTLANELYSTDKYRALSLAYFKKTLSLMVLSSLLKKPQFFNAVIGLGSFHFFAFSSG